MKTNLLVALILLGTCLQTSAKEFKICVNSEKLMYGLIQKENPRRDINAVGDKHLRHKAYGLLQIRKPYCDEAIKIAGKKEVRRRWGKAKLTEKDMKDPLKAKWACHVYLSYYGKYYTKITHKKPTVEVYARIHNGGPTGWKKKSTAKYGKTVVNYVRAYKKIGQKKKSSLSNKA